MSAELKTLLTIDDVAAYVNVSTNTVRSWVKAGKLPYLKAGQLLRFDPDELHSWLRSREKSRATHPMNRKSGTQHEQAGR